jgi:hypothetical protein
MDAILVVRIDNANHQDIVVGTFSSSTGSS